MPTFASIDVGSNASRLLIAEADGADKLRFVGSHRVPVRMGHRVFLTGSLDAEAMDACVAALNGFRQAMDGLELSATRAVITASARDAVNSDELLRRVERETGIRLEAISGTEEARLVKLAVGYAMPLGGYRSLLIDLGGGSLELSEVHHDEVRHTTSLEIGTVRLLESFLHPDKPVTPRQDALINEYIDRMLAPAVDAYRRRSYDLVIGTGGNFEVLARLCPKDGAEQPTIDIAKARALLPRMRKLRPVERQAAYDLKPDRADVIVTALYVVLRVADLLARTDEIVAPDTGLKEGILVELVRKHFARWDYGGDEHAVARAAVQLGRRYHFDEPHATQVDRLASRLFDALAPMHGMGDDERRLLRAAALLHDIGDFIASAAHHKHTQYIIEHTDVMGVSPDERAVVACVARYHRRSTPSSKHPLYGKLSTRDKKRVRKLASLLRIADALDRGHRSKVRSIQVQVEDGEVRVVPKGEDIELEVWTARRKADLFEKTFDLPIRIERSA